MYLVVLAEPYKTCFWLSPPGYSAAQTTTNWHNVPIVNPTYNTHNQQLVRKQVPARKQNLVHKSDLQPPSTLFYPHSKFSESGRRQLRLVLPGQEARLVCLFVELYVDTLFLSPIFSSDVLPTRPSREQVLLAFA